MSRPVILDLFCGAGGAGSGYHRAGFDVVGVDIKPQLDYPFTMIVGDALEYLAEHGHKYDAIHASPPCQASCTLTKGTNKGRRYINLIPATRELLATFDVPTVIENVQGADIRRDLTLCGEMFGLDVIRHRYFEVSVPIVAPAHKPHRGRVRGCVTASSSTVPTSPYMATGVARGRSPSGSRPWGSAGPTTARRSPRRSRRPTPEHIGARLLADMGVAA